jgi:hypothetical protein
MKDKKLETGTEEYLRSIIKEALQSAGYYTKEAYPNVDRLLEILEDRVFWAAESYSWMQQHDRRMKELRDSKI